MIEIEIEKQEKQIQRNIQEFFELAHQILVLAENIKHEDEWTTLSINKIDDLYYELNDAQDTVFRMCQLAGIIRQPYLKQLLNEELNGGNE